MKKLLILTLCVLFVSFTNAQILRNIARDAASHAKNTAANKASDKANEEVDKDVSKLIDNLTKEDSTKTKETKTSTTAKKDTVGSRTSASVSNLMKSFGMSTEIPPHKDLYKFTGQITSVTEITDNKGKKGDAIESTISFDEKSSDAMFNSKISGNQSSIIIDHENSCMIMLTQNQNDKTGLISKIDLSQKGTSTQTGKDSKPEPECKMVKTGKTQSISGFSCNEYRCETSSEISVAWVTKDYSAKTNSIFGGNSMSANYKTEGLDGMVIRYEFYSKTDKSSSIMTIKSIDMNKGSSCSLAGYQFTAFNFGQKK